MFGNNNTITEEIPMIKQSIVLLLLIFFTAACASDGQVQSQPTGDDMMDMDDTTIVEDDEPIVIPATSTQGSQDLPESDGEASMPEDATVAPPLPTDPNKRIVGERDNTEPVTSRLNDEQNVPMQIDNTKRTGRVVELSYSPSADESVGIIRDVNSFVRYNFETNGKIEKGGTYTFTLENRQAVNLMIVEDNTAQKYIPVMDEEDNVPTYSTSSSATQPPGYKPGRVESFEMRGDGQHDVTIFGLDYFKRYYTTSTNEFREGINVWFKLDADGDVVDIIAAE